MLLILGFSLWSLVAWVVLGWRHHPQVLRTWIARGLLTGVFISLVVAPFLDGQYSRQAILFIAGPNAYEVETIQRSFTFLALGIGLALLAFYAATRWGDRLPLEGPLGRTFKLTLAVLFLRVYVEKLGVPPYFAMLIGIIWLVLPLAIFFALEASKRGSQARFWVWLFSYAFGIRVLILVIMLVVTTFQLETHFDNSSVTAFTVFGERLEVEAGSWEQYLNLMIIPQLVLWPVVTLAAGLFLGWPVYLLSRRRSRLRAP